MKTSSRTSLLAPRPDGGGTGAWADADALYFELAEPCLPDAYADTESHGGRSDVDWTCLETCSGAVLAAVGDQAAFCALGDADYTDAERSALKEYVTGRPHGSPSLRTTTWTARRSSRA